MTAPTKQLLIALLVIIVSGCSFKKQHVTNDFIKPTEVAFFEFFQTQVGEVLQGKAPEGRRIDGPTYSFDKTTKKLEIFRKVDFSFDTIKVIIGNGKILKGASGSGLSKRINALNNLPATFNGLTIKEISSDGARLAFEGKKFFLKEGDEWSTSSYNTDTIKSETISIVRNTITYSIRYYGKLSKSDIR